ncbi:hypothetical protein Zmor_011013 [Zophobas morio]|uniref:Uncharacterized protein n=1 Tax=Zophobas morio TaxID=2755281 RepID=A0AA38MKH5_9CUCU|nr:hypothetical protein Zmor_011013 [Zophobas morio]
MYLANLPFLFGVSSPSSRPRLIALSGYFIVTARHIPTSIFAFPSIRDLHSSSQIHATFRHENGKVHKINRYTLNFSRGCDEDAADTRIYNKIIRLGKHRKDKLIPINVKA